MCQDPEDGRKELATVKRPLLHQEDPTGKGRTTSRSMMNHKYQDANKGLAVNLKGSGLSRERSQ